MRPLMDLRRTTERCSHAMGTARTNLDQPTALIISDDSEFSRAITARWQTERNLPAFTLVSGDLCQALDPDTFDLAVVGTLQPTVLASALKALESAGKPVLVVCEANPSTQAIREKHPTALVLRQDEGWLDSLMLVASEALRRCQAVARARQAEQANKTLEREATLGRYVLEMRHTMNNALTSVLGNSELLLIEPGSLSAAGRSQLETIRNMAVRLHEILQRFSSIEKEMSVIEKQTKKDGTIRSHTAAAAN
jgi:signal transduction histidine kinase